MMATNPIILADNILIGATITATGISDGSQLYLIDGRPYTWLQFPSAGTKTITIDCGSAVDANAIGIIGHNLAASAAAVTLASSTNGSSWTDRLTITAATDRALLQTFTKVSARYWRLTIVTATVAPMLAVVMIGQRIDFPLPPDSPCTPFTESVEVDSNESKQGHPLGAVVRYFPVEVKPSFSNLEREWVETVFRPFRENWSRYRTFFFWAWDLETYPEQILYLQDVGTYAPAVSHLAYYDKLSLSFKGVLEP